MSTDIIRALQADLLQRMPRLIETAVNRYTELASLPAPEDPKQYAAFQANCRAALAHLHLLLKLADWARAADEPFTPAADPSLEDLIRRAESALAAFPVEAQGDDEDAM